MEKIVTLLLALTMLLGLAAPAYAADGTDVLTAAYTAEPASLDPARCASNDDATLLCCLFSGLAKWSLDEDGQPVVVADCARQLVDGVANEDGSVTYTYTLKSWLKWSDGVPVTAADFEYAWRRAVSSDVSGSLHRLFSVISGYANWEAEYVDGSGLNVHALDATKLQVTLARPVPYWNELLACPCFFPVRQDIAAADPAWSTAPTILVCNGPFTLNRWTHGESFILRKNPHYHDADSVGVDRLKLVLSDSYEESLKSFKRGKLLFMDGIPTGEHAALAKDYADAWHTVDRPGTVYLCWNVNEELLPAGMEVFGSDSEAVRVRIRKAIGMLIDRSPICDEADLTMASTFVAPGISGRSGNPFDGGVSYLDGSGDAGEAREQGIKILRRYYDFDEETGQFTNFPVLTYLYDTDKGNQAVAKYLQQTLGELGITLYLDNEEYSAYLRTRRSGDFSLALDRTDAAYSDPICMLEKFYSGSADDDVQYGRAAHGELAGYDLDLTGLGYEYAVENGTWAQTYNVLIDNIRSCGDMAVREQLMHKAEDMLMDTGCILPLYYCTEGYLLDPSVTGFFTSPTGCRYFAGCTIES